MIENLAKQKRKGFLKPYSVFQDKVVIIVDPSSTELTKIVISGVLLRDEITTNRQKMSIIKLMTLTDILTQKDNGSDQPVSWEKSEGCKDKVIIA